MNNPYGKSKAAEILYSIVKDDDKLHKWCARLVCGYLSCLNGLVVLDRHHAEHLAKLLTDDKLHVVNSNERIVKNEQARMMLCNVIAGYYSNFVKQHTPLNRVEL